MGNNNSSSQQLRDYFKQSNHHVWWSKTKNKVETELTVKTETTGEIGNIIYYFGFNLRAHNQPNHTGVLETSTTNYDETCKFVSNHLAFLLARFQRSRRVDIWCRNVYQVIKMYTLCK